MEDGVDRVREHQVLGHVGADQPEAVVGHEVLDVGDRSGEKIVNTVNAVTFSQKPLTKMGAEKTGAAGNGHSGAPHMVFSPTLAQLTAAEKNMLGPPHSKTCERAPRRALRKISFDAPAGYDGRVATVNIHLPPYKGIYQTRLQQ
ncbi:hypothetical protein GCM10020216_058670 [Nonomuraea helvata]